MDPISQLEEWGYDVRRSDNDVDGVHFLRIEGAGVTTYILENDKEAIDSLLDLDGHIERSTQMIETDEETRERIQDGT